MNFRILINMVCFVVLATGVYLVKYSVQDVQRDVATLKRDLAQEKESLHLLNAEWAYLNRPDRLRQLADRHLDLVALDSHKIDEVKSLPAAATTADTVAETPLVHNASLVGGKH